MNIIESSHVFWEKNICSTICIAENDRECSYWFLYVFVFFRLLHVFRNIMKVGSSHLLFCYLNIATLDEKEINFKNLLVSYFFLPGQPDQVMRLTELLDNCGSPSSPPPEPPSGGGGLSMVSAVWRQLSYLSQHPGHCCVILALTPVSYYCHALREMMQVSGPIFFFFLRDFIFKKTLFEKLCATLCADVHTHLFDIKRKHCKRVNYCRG